MKRRPWMIPALVVIIVLPIVALLYNNIKTNTVRRNVGDVMSSENQLITPSFVYHNNLTHSNRSMNITEMKTLVPTEPKPNITNNKPADRVVKIYIYSSSPDVWLSNGGPNGELKENWIQFKRGPQVRHTLKCNSSLTLELSLGVDTKKFKENDVVLFNNVEDGLLPKRMKSLLGVSSTQGENDQVWIFKALESASYMRWIQPAVRSLPVHAILGYPSTADIQEVYGRWVPGKPAPNPDKPLLETIRNKTGAPVVWMAKNCINTFWPRLDFVHDLMKHIGVDTYGKCGKYTCQPRRSEKCLRLLERYKFYLSLENSECPDYITEKFWNVLRHGMVPVVYGPTKESYLKVAPPNSFIHIGDFNSTEELAKYLKHLDQNPKEYLKYLEWQKKGSIAHAGENPFPFCEFPEVMRRVKLGLNKKKPMSEFPMFDHCRHQTGRNGFNPGVKYNTWKPWS
ncbi:4-galactosyl-N-acetylglucosaminide 3-alpha-L-fucosyltransferase FUT6-like isoform X2 [Asterias amurensis]|uniref:4-galactosyl-N-acetylglucosaminide 3-alpha-L-fucosyltransferase FUT6-like isoform X2 n=1 Tax=Asterias amurensis TaxID=7602 RepID=UPI003AB39767